MLGLRYFLAAVVVATAMPHVKARSVKLDDVKNSTVCVMEVTTDFNQTRIPARIKIIKCLNTNHWCEENKTSQRNNCGNTNDDRVMECVEMTDVVLVFDKITNTTKDLVVPVGCACMIREKSQANDGLSMVQS